MLIKTKHFLTMLVVAGISAAALPSHAATTYVAGDLLLGFRATGGTGSTSNLIVDLGLATGYRDATSNITSVTDIGSLLISTYGSDWATRSDLSWGIVGARTNSTISAAVGGDPARTDYLSAAQTTVSPGTQQSTAWVVSGQGRTDTTADILGLGVAYAAAPGTNSSILNSTDAGSWSTNNSGSDSFRLGGTIEGNFANGASGTALDLYRVLNTNTGANPTGTVGVGSYEGTFTISSAGVVGFAAAEAVPEPSRAILAAIGLGGLLLRRRRSVKA